MDDHTPTNAQETTRLKKKHDQLTKDTQQFWMNRPHAVDRTERHAQYDMLDRLRHQRERIQIDLLQLKLDRLPAECTKRQATRKRNLRWEIWRRLMVLWEKEVGLHPGDEPTRPAGRAPHVSCHGH